MAPGQSIAKPARPAVSHGPVDVAAVCGAFEQWAKGYIQAAPEEREQLRPEGLRLAKARRPVMLQLIQKDPREALVRALPMVLRQDLPAEILAQIEQRVNARGFYGVLGALGQDGAPVATPISRAAQIGDGQRYEAFVYGKTVSQPTTPNAYLNGIALDKKLALDERPLRVLEAGERVPAAQPAVNTCPVSGKSVRIEAPGVGETVITNATPAVEVGGEIHFLCSGGHIHAFEEQLAAAGENGVAQEGSTGGAQKATGAVPTTWNSGGKTHLYIRVTFADQFTDPQSESSCYDMMRQVNDFIMENSYGKCYFLTTVTPLLVLPRTEAWYILNDTTGNAYQVLTDARTVAKAAGYDPASFDFDTVRYNAGPGGFGGQAYVTGKGCWLKSSSVGVAAHEYGHNLGLWHANYWSTNPASTIGPGSNVEYGNSFDTMGAASAGNNHYGAFNKSVLNWMSPELVWTVRQSGTYRIFTHDQAIADPARHYGLKVVKDTDRTYWCELRQKFTSNIWMMSGIQVTWDAWAQSNAGPQLLDMTPGSPDGVTDAQLVIGRTFSDREAGVYITPVGKGSTTPESMDVVVNVGDFSANQPPTLSLSPSGTTAAVSANLTFTATASDPEGDTLAYAWDFGDKSFATTNAPSVTKAWSTAGTYTVRCTASDMKGGVATRYVVVTIGSTSTLTVSGNVTNPSGQPIEGVLVSNGLTSTSFRGAYTDSAGNYTISNLASGSYTYSAQLFGFTFAPGFTNPVSTTASLTGLNFTSTAITTITLSAIDSSASENGDTGTFRITRTGSTAAAQIVRMVFPSGTASKGSDYTLSPDPTYNSGSAAYEVTIPAGSATLDIVLTAINDTTAEGPETAVLQLVPVSNLAFAGSNQATITIDDNDTTLPRVSIITADEFAHESGAPAQLLVTRTGPTDSALTVSFTTSGTAVNGTDYVSVGTSVIIPAGAASAPINIVPINDTLVEGIETGTVTVSTSAAYVRDSIASSSFTIEDDDVNVVTVSASDSTVSETGDTATFTITRMGDLTNALVVDYAVGGAALQGTDYFRLVGVATIAAGEASATVTVVPIDDGIGEAAQSVVLQLRSKTTYLVGTPFSATVNLADNDLPTISVNTTDGLATEPASGTATDTGTFRIYRAGGSSAFTVNYTVGGTATAGVDYTALSGSVAFAAGDTFKDIVVSPIADTLLEDMETVVLTLTPGAAYVVEPENTATLQIIDQDQPAVSVSNEATVPTEATAAVNFYVTRTGATTAAMDVYYTMSGTATAGSDYTAPPGVVTIPAGQSGVLVPISLINDTVAEGTESLTMNLTPTASYGLRIPSATYWISDNDTAGLPQVRFFAATGTGVESVTNVDILVTLSAASATPVSVDYYVNGGTALANGADYSFNKGTLTFDPGVTSLTIPLTIRDDVTPESNETVMISLINPVGATLGTSTYTYTITDNDGVPTTIGFAGANSTGTEDVSAPQTLVVALSQVSTSTVTVNYAVTGGTATAGADYSLPSGTLTFAPGEVTKHVPLSVLTDSTVESSESVIVTLSGATNATLNANTSHTYTITDNSQLVTLIASGTVPGEGVSDSFFTLSRAGNTTGAQVVNLAISGLATNGVDYATIPNTVTFPAGQTAVNVPLQVVNDTEIEGPETVTLTLLAGTGYQLGASTTATLTIADNDRNTAPSFAKGSNVSVGEDAGALSIPGWATSISVGPAADAGQTLTFFLSPDNGSLFAVPPAVSANGALTFTPTANAFGTAIVTIYAKDSGGTANGGSDTSGVQAFTIAVTSVNDAPTLNLLSDVNVLENSGATGVPLAGITSGAANEVQTLSVTAISDDPALLPNPTVTYSSPGSTGSLSIQPVAGAFGSTTVRVTVSDGQAQNSTTTRTFTVNVLAVNSPPSFSKGADQSVLEDAAAQVVPGWATNLSTGAANETGQALNFLVNATNASLFAVAPAVTPDGTLLYTPAANASGSSTVTVALHDSGGTADGGVDTSVAQTFTITVAAVNDAPSFTRGADVSLAEDAGAQTLPGWATNLSTGPADESAQLLSFEVSNDRPALFASAPAISADGTLRFTPAPDANGSATVTVVLHDNGGTQNGGVDQSAAQAFTITVAALNDPPTLDPLTNLNLNEDAPAHTIPLSGIGTGAANETQTLTITATSDDPSLVPLPIVTYTAGVTTGSLVLRPVADRSGTTTVHVTVNDGGAENATVTRSFTVTVTGLNDAPSFTAGPSVTVLEDAGPQTIAAWAKAISAGPADEAGQVLNFEIGTTNQALFSTAPALAADGALTFTPAPDANGSATVMVVLHDTGGTLNGGVDTSAPQTFTITVTAVNDAPTLSSISDLTLLENAAAATVSLTGISTGAANESDTLVVSATSDNPALIPNPVVTYTSAQASGSLSLQPVTGKSGSATITVTVNDGQAENGSVVRTFVVHVTAVNDAPTFTKGADVTVLEDAGARTLSAWATAIKAGPDDEAAQALDFIVSHDNPALFSAAPAISPSGALTFTPAANANGVAHVKVKLHDSGAAKTAAAIPARRRPSPSR